jgi:hypothetical protein
LTGAAALPVLLNQVLPGCGTLGENESFQINARNISIHLALPGFRCACVME